MLLPPPPPLPRRGVLAVAAAGLVVLVGCGKGEEIRSYDVKRTPADGPTVGGDGVRLLGAIIPVGDNSFFVKFKGTPEQIAAHEKAFDEFVASIRVPAGAKVPTFTAPPGWKESPARTMRVATFTPPGDGPQPELYLSTPFGGTLLMNVNRWRTDDAGLPAVAEADLPAVTTEIKLGETKAYKVDFKGPGGKKKGGPFAGGM